MIVTVVGTGFIASMRDLSHIFPAHKHSSKISRDKSRMDAINPVPTTHREILQMKVVNDLMGELR